MRKIARRDANHVEIVAAFRAAGCSVLDLAQLGGGCPDLLVGIAGRNVLAEVKDGEKSASATKLTPDQVKFERDWRGSKPVVVRELMDVPKIVNWYRRGT